MFLLFVLPGDTCLQRIHFNSAADPLANQTHALRIQSASEGPYIRLWRIGARWNESDYFHVKRNQYISFDIGVGSAQVTYNLEMNVLIENFA